MGQRTHQTDNEQRDRKRKDESTKNAQEDGARNCE